MFLAALTTLTALTGFLQDPERVDWTRLSRRLDADGDGRITEEEFPRRRFAFRRLDRDGDGVLTARDFGGRAPAGPELAAPAGPQDPEGLALFEAEVRGILELSCLDCHDSGGRTRGGLALDSLAGLLAGGDSGPAIAPGDPERSLLLEAVRYEDDTLAMPPDGPLAADEVAALERWISLGAPWPGAEVREVVQHEEPGIDLEEGRRWWAFQPVELPAVPEPEDRDWARDPIDAFLLARLEQEGLAPVADAGPRAWLRRVTFDLTGLPPTPEELAAFERDPSPAARERVVDGLLASPRFAERWGRHWLDVARYAESSGREANVIYPHAWRYRDWVIEAFERDLPHDSFLMQQIAGDLLPAEDEDERARRLVATGFLALGPKSHNERNPLQFSADVVDEQIDALSRGMLGLTLACARCHDHEFDPFATEDYYALAGILDSSRTFYGTYRGARNNRPSRLIELPAGADLPNGPDMPDRLRRFLTRGQDGLERRLEREREEVRAGDPEETMQPVEMFRRAVMRQGADVIGNVLERWDEEGRALPSNRLAMGMAEGRARDGRVLVRGEIDSPGERVERGFPEVLEGDWTPSIGRGSGRLELARWIASPENPLTARVWVNRVWSHLFGRGIVSSLDNFGASGELPTHPELLDWLAATFVEQGWSTRALVRRIVLSRAYGLATSGDARAERIDPESTLLWRMPPRRLEAEALRDAMLAAAGTLELERPVGSPIGVLEGRPPREQVLERLDSSGNVRSVYLPVLRDRMPHSLECFDAADPSFVSGQREETIAATQALYLMNAEEVLEAADALARRVVAASEKDRERIELAFELTLSRAPTSAERSAVQRFLKEFERAAREEDGLRRAERAAWSALAQSLFQSAEFRYRG